MFAVSKKLFLSTVVLLIVLTTGAWQGSPAAAAQAAVPTGTPLFPGLTWSSAGPSTKDIRLNIMGDTAPVSGEGFSAAEQFAASVALPEDLAAYYSNAELAKSGWASYDSFSGPEGAHYVFSNESGAYLFVEYLTCQSNAEMTCIAVWMSGPADLQAAAAPEATNAPDSLDSAAVTTFGKTSPTDGTSGLSTSVTLKWQSYSGAQKYKYCVNATVCNDTVNWDSTYDTNVTVTGLTSNKKYYWQIRAMTCLTCVPKKFVEANSGAVWSFTTGASNIAIVGNAGVGGATLSYVNGSAKTVTADSSGAYSITVPYKWSGTITPSKTNYIFIPASATLTSLTANQTILNFAAKAVYYISGSAGQPGVTFSYTDGTPKTVVSDASGKYSIAVTTGWSGTVTPSHPCYTFNPLTRSYTNVSGNQTLQDYAATFNLSPTCKNVDVTIGGALQGSNYVFSNQTVTASYTNLQNGPVKVTSRYNTMLFTSQRVISGNSFNEVMGYPADQLTTDYWFPWYDNTGMSTWVLVGNASSTQAAAVDIYIAGVKRGSYTIPIGGRITPRFNLQAGPVRVLSTNGVKIFTSERTLYGPDNAFNEVMGYPASQLTTEYWFPLYDNVSMTTWILVGNPTTRTASVNIYVGSAKYSYNIPPLGIITPRYPGKNTGPVQVVSTNGVAVFASERSLYGDSFNEVMGYPANQLTTQYWFPWYDNVSMADWVLVGNPSSSQTANVSVYVGTEKHSYSIPPRGSITTRIAGKDAGPVHVVSTNGVNVFTSQRVLYKASFNEVMGYPANKLTTEYWFPWYDNLSMTSYIYVGRP